MKVSALNDYSQSSTPLMFGVNFLEVHNMTRLPREFHTFSCEASGLKILITVYQTWQSYLLYAL